VQNIYLKLKKQFKLKNTFQKLLLSYISLIFLFLLTSMFVLYQGYRKQIIEQSSAVSEKIINQGEHYTEYTLGWARSYIYQLYLDDEIYNLMFDSNEDSELISSRYLKVKQAATMIPSIQSVYVYNRNTRMIYSSDGNSSYYSLFYDSSIPGLIRENNESISTKFIPRQIAVPLNGKEYLKNVLTVVLSNTKADPEGIPYGAIVLNLDANAVQAYFENMSENDYNLMAINKKGEVILSSDRDMFLKDISSLDYVNKIITSNSKEGSFLANIKGKPSIITYKYNEELDLVLMNMVKYETLLGSLRGMVRALTSTFIILFLFGVAFSIFSSKRIYTPIAKTVSMVKRYLDIDDEEEPGNELEYVTKVIDTLASKPISFAKLSDKDLYFIKNQMLKGLLLNTVTDFEGFRSKLREVGFDSEGYSMCVVLYKIDSYKKLMKGKTEEEGKNIKNKLCIKLSNMLPKYFEGEAVSIEEDEVCLIIKTLEPDGEDLTQKILQLIEESQEAVLDNLEISLSAAIGRYAGKIENLAASYKNAQDCCNYRLKYGLKSVLYNEKIASGISGEAKYDEAIEEAIFRSVKLGDLNEVESELGRMFSVIEGMSFSDIMISIAQLGNNSQKVINNIYQMGRENAYIDIKEFTDNLARFETIDMVKDYFLNLYRNTIEQLKEKKTNRRNDVIENVKKYIGENYSDPLLTLDLIASEMRFSPNYLRTLFKEFEGKSISNYINEIRFEKAKELLETTDLTAMDVSLKIGFANANYFYTAFKKYYGVSPNQFRNSINSIS
jgi:two-component system, response regulator YesN